MKLTLWIMLACCLSFEISASQYWVLGSYSAKENALAISSGIQERIEKPVLIAPSHIKGTTYYRLLLSNRDYTKQVQSLIKGQKLNPWALNVDPETIVGIEDAPETLEGPQIGADTNGSKYFSFVIGSYTNVTEALEIENSLSSVFDNVSSQTTILKGKVYHRILVGPIVDNQIQQARELLLEQGFDESWLINADIQAQDQIAETKLVKQEASQVDANQKIETVLLIDANQYSKRSLSTQVRKRAGGFNLAKLPEKKTNFSRLAPDR